MSLLSNILQMLHLSAASLEFDEAKSINFTVNEDDSSSASVPKFIFNDDDERTMKLDHMRVDLHQDNAGTISPTSKRHMHLLKEDVASIILTNLIAELLGVVLRIERCTMQQEGTSSHTSLWKISIVGQVDIFIQGKHIGRMEGANIRIQTVRAEMGVRIELDFSMEQFVFTGREDHLIILKRIVKSWSAAFNPDTTSPHNSIHSPLGVMDPASPFDSHSIFGAAEDETSKDYIVDENGHLQLRPRPTTLTLSSKIRLVKLLMVKDDSFDYKFLSSSHPTSPLSTTHLLFELSHLQIAVNNTHEAITTDIIFDSIRVCYTTHGGSCYPILQCSDRDDTTKFNIQTKLKRHTHSRMHFKSIATAPPLEYLWVGDSFDLFRQTIHVLTTQDTDMNMPSSGDASPLHDVLLHQVHLDQILRKSQPYESHISLDLRRLSIFIPQSSELLCTSIQKDDCLCFELRDAHLASTFFADRNKSEIRVQCGELYAYISELEVLCSVSPSLSLTICSNEPEVDLSEDEEDETPSLQHNESVGRFNLHDIYSHSPTQISFDSLDLQLKMTSDQFSSFRQVILHSCRTISHQQNRISPRSRNATSNESVFEDGNMQPDMALKVNLAKLKWSFLNCQSTPDMPTHNYILSASSLDVYGLFKFHPNLVVRYNASTSDQNENTFSLCEEKENGEHRYLLRCNKRLQKFRKKRCFSFGFVQSVVPSLVTSHSTLNLSLRGVFLDHDQHLSGGLWLSNLSNYFNAVDSHSGNIMDWVSKEEYHVKLVDCLTSYPQPQSLQRVLALCDMATASVNTSSQGPSTVRLIIQNLRILADLDKIAYGDFLESLLKKRGPFGISEDLMSMQICEVAHSDHLRLYLEYQENSSSLSAEETSLTVHYSPRTYAHMSAVLQHLFATAPPEANPLLTPPKKTNALSDVLNEFDYALKRTGQTALETFLTAPLHQSDEETVESVRSSVELLPLDIAQVDQGEQHFDTMVLNDGVTLRCLRTMSSHPIVEGFLDQKDCERSISEERKKSLLSYGTPRCRIQYSVANCEVFISLSDETQNYFKYEASGLQLILLLSLERDTKIDWVLAFEVREHSLYDSIKFLDKPIASALGREYELQTAFKCELVSSEVVSSEGQYGPSISVHIDIAPLSLNIHQYHIDMVDKLFSVSQDSESSCSIWDSDRWKNVEFSPIYISEVRMRVSYTSSEVKQGHGWVHSVANLVNFKDLEIVLQEVDIDELNGSEQLIENLIANYARDLSESAQVFQLAFGILPIKSLVNVTKSVGDIFMIPISAYQSSQETSAVVRGIQQGLVRFARELAVESSATLSHLSLSSATLLESSSPPSGHNPLLNTRRERPRSGVEGLQQAAETLRDTVRVLRMDESETNGSAPSYMLLLSSPAKAVSQVFSGLQASLEDGSD